MSPIRICAVLNGKSRSTEGSESFQRSPYQLEQIEWWCKLLGIAKDAKTFYVCSNHFSPDAYRFRGWHKVLKNGALPSRCVQNPVTSTRLIDHDYISRDGMPSEGSSSSSKEALVTSEIDNIKKTPRRDGRARRHLFVPYRESLASGEKNSFNQKKTFFPKFWD